MLTRIRQAGHPLKSPMPFLFAPGFLEVGFPGLPQLRVAVLRPAMFPGRADGERSIQRLFPSGLVKKVTSKAYLPDEKMQAGMRPLIPILSAFS